MASGAKLNGAAKVRAKLQRFAERFPDEVARALRIETEIEAKEVKRRTPVDRGPLRASVHVEGPFRQFRKVWTMIVAGGPAAPYAIYVHENLEAYHEVGQAKFVESVVMQSRSSMGARVAARIELNRAVS